MGKNLQFLMVFFGFLLLMGAVAAGIGAYEYEVKKVDTVEGQAPELREFVEYENLDGDEKELVDRAIAGESIAIREAHDLPGAMERQGKIGVHDDGTYHVLTRRMFFNWRTTFGMVSIGLGVAGVALISEGIRRRQFPHRPVYWFRV